MMVLTIVNQGMTPMTEPETYRLIRREHADIARLLNALEAQLDAFDRAERPDYELIDEIAEYFLDYPDRCHHPKEDAVFRALQERAPDAAKAVGDLEAEHRAIGEQSRVFKGAIANILSDAEVSRETIDTIVRGFIETERKHMAKEERDFLPAALSNLTAADWAAVEAAVPGEDDPLFGPNCADRYKLLRDDIIALEAERGTS